MLVRMSNAKYAQAELLPRQGRLVVQPVLPGRSPAVARPVTLVMRARQLMTPRRRVLVVLQAPTVESLHQNAYCAILEKLLALVHRRVLNVTRDIMPQLPDLPRATLAVTEASVTRLQQRHVTTAPLAPLLIPLPSSAMNVTRDIMPQLPDHRIVPAALRAPTVIAVGVHFATTVQQVPVPML